MRHFRCFNEKSLFLSPGFNCFMGENGSGKTSILEAIYYLGLGKSFRTHLVRRIVSRDEQAFSLFGRFKPLKTTEPLSDNALLSIGIQREIGGDNRIRINGEESHSRADLVKSLPMQLINTESYRLIDSGPVPRRAFLDWGVFHVKHDFLPMWQHFRKNLKQRNAALRTGVKSNVAVWTTALADMGEALHAMRAAYFAEYSTVFTPLIEYLLPNIPISLAYYPGWDTTQVLKSILEMQWEKDLSLGYTTMGAQRADIRCHAHGVPAGAVLSRGQQKLLVIAMRLAQGLYLRDKVGKEVIYLVDDVAAELDQRHRDWVMQILQDLNSQVLLTAITRSDLSADVAMNEINLDKNAAKLNVSRET